MEKNKQQNLEDAFLKKHLQEIKLASLKSNFTTNIMDAILKEEKQTVLKIEPLISKKVGVLVVWFIAFRLWCASREVKDADNRNTKVKFRFFSHLKISNLFDNLAISNTLFYAVVLFTGMLFIQITFLKNHFDKRFE